MVYDDGCKSYLQEYNQIVVNIDYINHLRKVLCKKDLTSISMRIGTNFL